MNQEIFNFEIDLTQPLEHWAEYYESNPGVRSIWTRGSFLQLIKMNREFFGDSVVNLRNGTYLRESFPERLNAWLSEKRPNNLRKAA